MMFSSCVWSLFFAINAATAVVWVENERCAQSGTFEVCGSESWSPDTQRSAGLWEVAAKPDWLHNVFLDIKCTEVLQPNFDSKMETGSQRSRIKHESFK